MNPQHPYSHLEQRVQRGEPAAARRFREEMKPELEVMVRQALDQGAVFGSDKTILVEIDKVLARNCGLLARDSEHLPGVVAERLCDKMIDRLQAQGRGRQPAAGFAGRETVLC